MTTVAIPFSDGSQVRSNRGARQSLVLFLVWVFVFLFFCFWLLCEVVLYPVLKLEAVCTINNCVQGESVSAET
ncbi:hypothetical protein BDV26DRAFT_276677 [Aspergillus bertholletiae]|uniref:Uncharacterized protein n=1 Tax=Aspergillus bertholletiae TaxID=1226010 RepID=A0A5N7AMP8_9EURO|nr:hypothetical protein BDV26DRAFT_276677 [Aspergillus bertholletiae]